MTCTSQPAASEAELCVLLVEDDDLDAYLTTEALSGLGGAVRVVRANDGQEAFAMLASKDVSPDLAIVDLQMPVVDGHGLMKRCSDHGLAEIPFVVLTTHSDWEDDMYSRFNGASHFITKSPDPADLRLSLASAIDELALARGGQSAPTSQTAR